MTFKKLIGLGLMLWAFLGIIKGIYFSFLDVSNIALILLYGVAIVLFATALSRRLGVINYLESVLVAGVWFFLQFILDFLVLSAFLGIAMYRHWQLWVGYIVMMLSVFLFHKKRHIEIRKEQAAHLAHQHGHGGAEHQEHKHEHH